MVDIFLRVRGVGDDGGGDVVPTTRFRRNSASSYLAEELEEQIACESKTQ
jgi:hypothetical protein